MNQITIKGYAKINLTLDVIGKKPDGYHLVEMIMQQISLCDEITLETAEEGIIITTDSEHVPANSENLAWRAADLMRKTYRMLPGLKIHIAKQIPVAAGLAGGSADAAAVIEGMDRLFKMGLTLDEKMALGLKLGADVPFCLMGGAALAQGIGEKLRPIKGLKEGWIVICKPNFGVSTVEVYQNFNWEQVVEHPDTLGMLQALEENQWQSICDGLCNVLETVTLSHYSEVKVIKEKMLQYGAEGVLMSGSGPTVFGIFKSSDCAQRACANLERSYQQSYVVRPIENRGSK